MGRLNVARRTDEILAEQLQHIHEHADRLFSILLVVQWVVAVAAAILVTPQTSIGRDVAWHLHVWTAILLGGLLSMCPIVMAIYRPGGFATRVTVAVAQMLYSGLLIHLTGGRIETHFHVFGSLAAIAFYRDWRLFVPATIVAAADLFARGIWMPQSVFGSPAAEPWRAVEHLGWVLFEDGFLIWGCTISIRELRVRAAAQAELEFTNQSIEGKFAKRNRQLEEQTAARELEITKRKALELQLLQAQKLESIGQLAAGIAHEINTPMQFVHDNIEFLSDCSDKLFTVVESYQRNLSSAGPGRSWQERADEVNRVIEETRFDHIRTEIPNAIRESVEGIQRVINIVRAMKEFSHPGHSDKVGVDLNNAVCSTMTITRNRWKYIADLELDLDPDLPTLRCVAAEINQVLLNLVVNAADAIAEKLGEDSGMKGIIKIRTRRDDEFVVIEISDTGCGIPDEVRNRIFDPFFTTKEVGKGSGQGLAICYNVVVNKHHGLLEVDSTVGVGTTFRVCLYADPPENPDDQARTQDNPQRVTCAEKLLNDPSVSVR